MTASVYFINCEYRFFWEMHHVRHCCDVVQSLLSRVLVTIDVFWIGWLDLLHLIHSHNSGLQVNTALSLLYTHYSSPLHTH
jgi:hypothetical protein